MHIKSRIALTVLAALMGAGAQAKITDMASPSEGATPDDGNSSLSFIALDKVGNPVSVVADLGWFFNDFRPLGAPGKIGDGADGLTDGYLGASDALGLANKPGTTVVWNFNNNTTTINGVVSNLTNGKANDWAASFASFASQAQSNETQWAVIAGDTAGYYGDGSDLGAPVAASGLYQDSTEIFATADPTQLLFQIRLGNTLGQNVAAAGSQANKLLQGVKVLDKSQGNGAVVANAGNAYAGGDSFSGTWGGNFTFTSLADVGKTQSFYHLTDAPQDPSGTLSIDRPYVTEYAGVFTYADGQLTYRVAEVPEPETLAMMLVGLLGIAGVARRRERGNR